MRLEALSEELWRKLREKFPEKSMVVEVVKVMEELGEVADLALRVHKRQRKRKLIPDEELRKRIKEEISDVIITLVMMAKDMDIKIWEALEERMTEELNLPL